MSDEKYTGGSGLSNLFGKGGRRRSSRYDQNQDGGEGDLEKMSGGDCPPGEEDVGNGCERVRQEGGRRRRRKSRKAPKKSRKSRRGRKSRKN